MIDHQQILYKHKDSFKVTKALPLYELPNYDYIELNKEKSIRLMKKSSRIIRTTKDDYINPGQCWIYRFINKSLNVDIESTKVTQVCSVLKLNPKSIRVYIKSGKPYKGFNITRKPYSR
jgi:hypothetical protein